MEMPLTDQDKAKIDQFLNDRIMVQAVQKVLLSTIYFEGTIQKEGIPNKNFILDLVPLHKNDKELGSVVRASFTAIKLIQKGFKELNQFRKRKKQDKNKGRNPAV